MSQLDGIDKGRSIAVPKAKPDIYTVMLGIALVAILIAITLLCLELARYNWDYNARSVKLTNAAPAANVAPAPLKPLLGEHV